MRKLKQMLGALFVFGLAVTNIAAPPLPRAHAHNDYEHLHPLLDALDNGFCSVEADIYLVDGQLLVAHNIEDVKPERTLQSLYFDPLRERFRAGGHVYPEFSTNAALRKPISPSAPDVEFTLLIDFKSEGIATYQALRGALGEYEAMLTHFTSTSTVPGAVTIILTGNRPGGLVAAESRRLCALDGGISDLESNPPVHLVPLISGNWRQTFGTNETTALSDVARAKLRQLVAKAHDQGRRLRFWGAPDKLSLWRELYSENVDLLNTDHLSGLAVFLQSAPLAAAQP